MHSRRRFLGLAGTAVTLAGTAVTLAGTAVTLAGLPGRAWAGAPRVLVVGGGPAGLSAALELAERGVAVTLVEAADRLGGRVEGWTEPLVGKVEHEAPAVDVECAAHAFGPDHRHATGLLLRYGLDGALVQGGRGRMGVRAPGGRTRRRAADPLDRGPPPGRPLRWLRGNADDWLWRPLGEVLLAMGGELRLGTRVRALKVEGGRVVGVEVGQPGARLVVPHQGAWSEARDGDGLPVFVQDGADGARAWHGRCAHRGCPLTRVPEGFACGLDGARYDLAGRPLAGPASAPLRRLDLARLPGDEGGGYQVDLPDTTWALGADHVILAVDLPGLARLAGPLLPQARPLRGLPHTVARFWLDRDVDMGDRSPVAWQLQGTRHATVAVLLHRVQEASAGWAARTGGAVIEVQAPRQVPTTDSPSAREAALDAIEADLRACWPELAGAAVLKRCLVQGERDTGAQESGLSVEPGVPGLLLAGDHLRAEGAGPGIERAVYTGRLAANAVLRDHGLPQAPLVPVPGAR